MALMGGRRRWALAARWPNAIADSSSQGARKTIPTSAGISVKTMETLDWRLRTVTGCAAHQNPQRYEQPQDRAFAASRFATGQLCEVQKRRARGQNSRRCEGAHNPACQGAPIRRHLVAGWLVQLPGPKDGRQFTPVLGWCHSNCRGSDQPM